MGSPPLFFIFDTMDVGTKRNLIFVAKWVGFWGAVAFVDMYFDIAIFQILFTPPCIFFTIPLGAVAFFVYRHFKSKKK